MVQKSININHGDAAFISNDGSYIKVGEDSAVKIGFGTSISNGTINNSNPKVLADFEGAIRINKATDKLEYCNGSTWVEILTTTEEEDIPLIYSLIF